MNLFAAGSRTHEPSVLTHHPLSCAWPYSSGAPIRLVGFFRHEFNSHDPARDDLRSRVTDRIGARVRSSRAMRDRSRIASPEIRQHSRAIAHRHCGKSGR
jgi:hypothetical protein